MSDKAVLIRKVHIVDWTNDTEDGAVRFDVRVEWRDGNNEADWHVDTPSPLGSFTSFDEACAAAVRDGATMVEYTKPSWM